MLKMMLDDMREAMLRQERSSGEGESSPLALTRDLITGGSDAPG